MSAETKRKDYMQRWESYKSQKLKEKSDASKKTKCTSSKVTKFSGITKLRRQTLASFESKKIMDSRSRMSLAANFQPRTDLKDLNSNKKKPKIINPVKAISATKENMPTSAKLVSTSRFRDVPSRTDSNLTRRKTLDPNFKRRLPKDTPATKKEPVTNSAICKSPIKKEITLQKELKSLLMSTNFGTPNTVKIPKIRNKKVLQDSCQNGENVQKTKRRSVKFLTPEHTSKPYSHSQFKSLDERDKMNEWLRKRGKAPVTNRHSSCFCKKVDQQDCPHGKRIFTEEEIMMQKQMLDNEKCKLPECNQASPKKCEVPQTFDNCLPKIETPDDIQKQLDPAIQECSILLDAGCPPHNILQWLEEIQERLPAAMKSAEFWLLKARVYAINKDMDNLLEVFSSAMQHGATPIEIIARSMPQIIKDVIASSNEAKNAESYAALEEGHELTDADEINDNYSVYSPSQTPIKGWDSIFDYDTIDMEMKTPLLPSTPDIMKITASSTIKYSLKKTTPFKKRINNHDDSAVIVTPVRRSTRKCMGRKSFGDSVINSLEELSLSDKRNLLLKSNTALENFN